MAGTGTPDSPTKLAVNSHQLPLEPPRQARLRPQVSARAAGTATRLVKFALVGLACLLIVQLPLLALLTLATVPIIIANGIAFATSALVNYFLSSRWTWKDERRDKAWARRLTTFFLVALISLVINSIAFAFALIELLLPPTLSAVLSVAFSSTITYAFNHFLVFSSQRASTTIRLPSSPEQLARATQGKTVSAFLPAYNEENALPLVVASLHAWLSATSLSKFHITIVNDGSTDGTASVARTLAEQYSNVGTVNHDENSGYGATVRTGLKSAVASGSDYWAFCDADGQFLPEGFADLICALHEEDVDLAVGVRQGRSHSDTPWRYLLGRLWHTTGRIILGTRLAGIDDVDCGQKAGRTASLARIVGQLDGQAAAISPELIARTVQSGQSIVQRPVTHLARLSGQPTGAKLSVAASSALSLLRLSRRMRHERRSTAAVDAPTLDLTPFDQPATRQARALTLSPSRTRPSVRKPLSGSSALVGGAAAVVSICAYFVTERAGAVLAYNDAIAHLQIARRTIAGSEGLSFGQLGNVWPPFTHILTMPLVAFDAPYQSGLAGSIVSMVAFIVLLVATYLTILSLTRDRLAALAGALGLGLNINVLYLQSTPMTELPLFAALMSAIYFTQRFIASGDAAHLSGACLSAICATLIRYEAWVTTLVLIGTLTWAVGRQSATHPLGWPIRRRRAEDMLIVSSLYGGAGVIGWLAWNASLFGSPTAFQSGQYANSSLWVDSGELAIGSLSIATLTYLYAIVHTVGWPLIMFGSAGFAYLAWQWRSGRRSPLTLPILAPLILIPFFISALYFGQRPLHVPEIVQGSADLQYYNIRFGLVVALPAACLAGCLVAGLHLRPILRRLVAAAIILSTAGYSAASLYRHDIASLTDAVSAGRRYVAEVEAGAERFLINNYDGRLMLMESFGNERLLFESSIPVEQVVYEGSNTNDHWLRALADPKAADIAWIVMRSEYDREDAVFDNVSGEALAAYDEVFADANYRIYRLDE